MGALVPLSGSVVRFSEFFVDPALAFANGWNMVYSYIVSIQSEIVAAAVLVEFWTEGEINSAVWITIFGALIIISSLLFVRVFGELEFGKRSSLQRRDTSANPYCVGRLLDDQDLSGDLPQHPVSSHHMRRRSERQVNWLSVLETSWSIRPISGCAWIFRTLHGLLVYFQQRLICIRRYTRHCHRSSRNEEPSTSHSDGSQAYLLASAHLLCYHDFHGDACGAI